jgi:hypothetical protein
MELFETTSVTSYDFSDGHNLVCHEQVFPLKFTMLHALISFVTNAYVFCREGTREMLQPLPGHLPQVCISPRFSMLHKLVQNVTNLGEFCKESRHHMLQRFAKSCMFSLIFDNIYMFFSKLRK